MNLNKIKKILFIGKNKLEFRTIEKKIDEYIDNQEFFSLKLPDAIFNLLISYELIRRGSNIAGLSENQSMQLPLSSMKGMLVYQTHVLENTLYFAFNKCQNEKIPILKNAYQEIYNRYRGTLRNPDFWFLMMNYSMFEYGCKMMSREYFDVQFKGKTIIFKPKNYEFFRYLSFGYKKLSPLIEKRASLHAAREFINIKEKDVREIDKILHFWLHRTRFFPSNIRIPFSNIHKLTVRSFGKIKSYIKISSNWEFDQYSIEDFRRLWIYLDIKCSLHMHYFDPFLSRKYEYPFFYIQTRKDWENELSSGSHLEILKVKKILEDLTFNPTIKNLGVSIQPFVPFGGNYLALSPWLVCSSLIEGNFLELQSKKHKLIYDGISQQKENILLDEIINILQKRRDVNYKDRIIISKDNLRITDIDLAVVERQTRSLVLIQTKWLMRPRYIYDIFNKNEEIDNGYSQVEKSFNYVKDNLKSFLSNNFQKLRNIEIQNIYSILVARDNIGANLNVNKEFPIVDYEIFKMYLEKNEINVKDICEKLYKYEWLPKADVDFKIGFPKLKIFGYEFKIPGIKM